MNASSSSNIDKQRILSSSSFVDDFSKDNVQSSMQFDQIDDNQLEVEQSTTIAWLFDINENLSWIAKHREIQQMINQLAQFDRV